MSGRAFGNRLFLKILTEGHLVRIRVAWRHCSFASCPAVYRTCIFFCVKDPAVLDAHLQQGTLPNFCLFMRDVGFAKPIAMAENSGTGWIEMYKCDEFRYLMVLTKVCARRQSDIGRHMSDG